MVRAKSQGYITRLIRQLCQDCRQGCICKSPTPFQEGSVFQFIDKCPVTFVIFLFNHCMLTELHSLCLPVSLVVHWYNVHGNVILLMWIQSDDFNSHSREHSPETENNFNYCMCSLNKSNCINSDAIDLFFLKRIKMLIQKAKLM